MAKRLGMAFTTRSPWEPRDADRNNVATTQSTSYTKPTPDIQFSKRDRYICLQLWAGPQINFNGDMLGCCVVKDAWGAGNVFDPVYCRSLKVKK